MIGVDIYVYHGIKFATETLPSFWRQFVRVLYWLPVGVVVVLIGWYALGNPDLMGEKTRSFVISGIITTYFAKIFAMVFFLADDVRRGVTSVTQKLKGTEKDPAELITRSEFLTKAALISASIPVGVVAFGILSGAHDYRVRRIRVKLANLPSALNGLRIGQVSDIHSGSFFNKTAVKGGVEMMMAEKPDLLFFTGDLVNNATREVQDYVSIFEKFKAPLGVFSVTGNHDYGDYRSWPDVASKKQNFLDLIEAHKLLGFNLLLNANHQLLIDGERISIIGIENWGAGGFSKYGDLKKAMEGTDDSSIKLLLSHDPSHWEAQVVSKTAIDISFAGHTHGFQFGVEIPGIQWSPAKYIYKQWAGLYQNEAQYLYVNRGFGYLGFPGRVGMPPELTILELVKG